MSNCPRMTALKDIADEIKKSKEKHMTRYHLGGISYCEIWTVTAAYLNSRKSRKLNRELGLHVVNMDSNNMNRKTKTKTRESYSYL
jgi:hypothetical protein